MHGETEGPAGRVEAIFTSPAEGGQTEMRPEVEAVAGRGLEGDRYFAVRSPDADPGKRSEITLIEAEAIDAVCRDYKLQLNPGETRRNVVTRGVALNHLVNRVFRVGEAEVEGVRLCEPCGYLERLTRPGIREALIHRGGLRARIVKSGRISVGDAVTPGAAR